LFIDHAPIPGGAQLVLAAHVEALDHSKFEVHVACTNAVPDLVQRFERAGARVHLMDIPRLRGLKPAALVRFGRTILQLRQLLRQARIQVAVSNTARASYLLAAAAAGTGVHTVWWVRDFHYPRRLFRLLQRLPRRIIYVSQAVRDHYDGEDDPRSLVWHVASDMYSRLPGVSAQAIAAERAKYGFTARDTVVGFMGRLVAEKGPEDQVEAVGALSGEFPQLAALLVGTGRGQPNDVESQLHDLVSAEGLESRIRFAGYQQDEALYYSLFDIFVLATRDREPYATSVVQAMMAGKPVIGTRAGGTPEIIEDGVTGLLYPPGNVESLSAAIRRLLTEPELGPRLASAGRDRVMRNNLEEQLARKAEALYRELSGA
jgi:glycosyltransferase involved in cell wall biosynthesis